MELISDYLYAKASKNKVPLSGGFELSPVCNFRCKMCYIRKTAEQIKKEGRELIPWQKWLSLAQQCKEAGTLYLLLTGGEPFLYPGFRELYTELHKMGFLLSMNTNGSLIDEDTMVWLKQYAPTRMNVTLYGASRETYGKLCGNPDGFDKTIRAIHLLKEAGIPIVINASMIPENADDMEKIMEIGRSLELNTRVSTYMFPPVRRDREESDSRFTPEEASQMFMRRRRFYFSEQELEDMLRKEREAREQDDWGAQDEHMRCRAGRSSFWVSWEGKMSACGLFPFPMEFNAFQDSFLDSWLTLTDSVRCATVLEKCRNCKLREICTPCAATVHAECGDVNGKAEYLCQTAECIEKEIIAFLEERNHEKKS